ncbi:MAG TPA: response regulator transcription factor [Planctomycetes bacterium]|nr:response regulator transcription factor [Planctomycetota bacterium]
MTHRLLVVEDDPTLRTGLEDAFAMEGYDVTVAQDGFQAEEFLHARHFSVVVLDIMMPGKSGLEVLKSVRDAGILTPVILLTARSDENDRVFGLELGADDYVTKPFSLRELLARVKVLIRREERVLERLEELAPPQAFRIGEAEVDLGTFTVTRDGQTYPLTPKEAGMLHLLERERGRVVSRDCFLREVWEDGEAVTHRTVDTHMLNLRKKIEKDPSRPEHLQTVHGAGYRLT